MRIKKGYTPATFPKLAPRRTPGSAEVHASEIARNVMFEPDQRTVPGLNRGPYEQPLEDASLADRIASVRDHLDGLPCPGCKEALRVIADLEARH